MSDGIKLIKRKRLIIGISIGLSVLILGIILLLVFGREEESVKKDDKQEEETEEVVEDKKELLPLYVNDSKTDKVSIYSTRVKLYSMDIDSGSDIVEESSYDGYYVTKVDGVYYLKRKQRVVSKLTESNNFVLYRDKKDADSKYIGVKVNSDDNIEFTTLDNDTYGSGYTLDSNGEKYLSIIYNVNTGKNSTFIDDSIVSVISGNNNNHYSIFKDKMYLLKEDFTIIDTHDYEIIGDVSSDEMGLTISSNSSKYIVVTKDEKYGLMDYNGKVVLDTIYDDLLMVDDNLALAIKDGKHGVIDANNNVVIDFKYDGIRSIGDYYVVVVGKKLGVINKSGQEVVSINIDILVEYSFSLSGANNFYTYYDGEDIIVEYYVPNSKEEYDRNYLVIYKDKTYEIKEENIDKYYNFSEKYYYVDSSNDKVLFYDQDKILLGEIECGSAYGFEFRNSEIMSFVCFTSDTEEKYFNVKTKKEVDSFDEDSLEYNEVGILKVFDFDDRKHVVDTNGELIFRLSINDKITYVCDNYYKIERENKTIEYYKVNV